MFLSSLRSFYIKIDLTYSIINFHSMSRNGIWAFIVIVVLVVGGIIYFNNRAKNNSTTSNNTTSTNQTFTPPTGSNVVVYTDSGFSPSTLTVAKGTTVIFFNNASDAVRVASDPHPLHNGYPTTGGCVSSTFDACANTAPGSQFDFKFDISGTWGFHNHLNPSEKGTIVVQP